MKHDFLKEEVSVAYKAQVLNKAKEELKKNRSQHSWWVYFLAPVTVALLVVVFIPKTTDYSQENTELASLKDLNEFEVINNLEILEDL